MTARPGRRRRELVVTQALADLLVTCGLLLVLFCLYELVWTDVQAGRGQAAAVQDLERSWSSPDAAASGAGEWTAGEGVALLRIPRLGEDYVQPVIEGVKGPDLARGVGHYPETAQAGQVGNFAVAGHRTTHGHPFGEVDALRPGDPLIVETRTQVFRYVVDGASVVKPTHVAVLFPVPGQADAVPTQARITLTTCHPKWKATERLVISGHLESAVTKPVPATEGR